MNTEESRLIELAREIIGDKDIGLDTDRENVSEWDSLMHVMLIAAVAEEMNINIPIDEVKRISCLKDILKYAK